jgi:hypothetical protein
VIHEESIYVIEHILKKIRIYGLNRMQKRILTHIVATNSVKVLMRKLFISQAEVAMEAIRRIKR